MSASMSSPYVSITHSSVLSFGALISQCCSVLSFGVLIHVAICTSTPVTLIFILTLRVTSLDSRPKRRQSRPTSGSQGSKCEHIGGSKNFRGGPNTSVKFGPGVQILRDSPCCVLLDNFKCGACDLVLRY